ncbi:MAG: hypothetical protein IKA19_03550 [Muribaculaceae bacterium]|nr:hypothetical protein [Muribaculaceae bacterium]
MVIDNTYYGNHAVRNTTRGLRLYNEVGYIDIHGDSVSYHYMVRDYLGSIRAIVGPGGTLEQATDYTVTGIPYTATTDQSGNRRLHTGKELRTFNGLYHYDNHARIYDPLTGRFTTIDPLAGQYPSLTPYNHCANNPLTFIDSNGMEIVIAEEDRKNTSFNMRLGLVRSALRKYRLSQQYDEIEQSKEFKLTIKNASGDKNSNYFEPSTQTLYIDLFNAVIHKEGVNSPLFILRHEMDHIHAYMVDRVGYKMRMEAKDKQYDNLEEKRVITGDDIKAGKVLEEPTRTKHGQYIRVYIDDPTSNDLNIEIVREKQHLINNSEMK